MSSLGQRPKARRGAPKVKTGCRTCKTRRVKCDEGKPSCFKCTSTGRTCDGYAPINRNFEVQIWSSTRVSNPQPAMSTFQGFGDSVRHLEFYYRCVGPALSTNFDKEFWSRTTLQMAYSEPAVRHALVALGSLFQKEPGDLKHARSQFMIDTEQKVVLSHYNKSIKSLVDRMSEATYSSEIGLVTCLLYVCIELLQGNYQASFTHMRSGFKIISHRRKPSLLDSPFSHNNGPSQALATESLSTKTLVENTLIPIFVRGVSSALIHGFQVEEDLDIPSPIPSTSLPRLFATIFEVQQAYHELQNASILHVSVMGRTFLMRGAPETKAFSDQSDLLACHYIWEQNLKQFQQQNRLSDDEKATLYAVNAAHHTTFIYVSCSMEVRETPYDAHIERFRDIVRHCKFVLESKPANRAPVAHFSFDVSIIPILHFVAIHCRCPSTRRQAVALLARNPPREGMWDPQQVVVVAKRTIELEERQVDRVTGWPVEESRMWQCVIQADMDRNGGFWARFLPVRWVGVMDENGRQKILEEFFVL